MVKELAIDLTDEQMQVVKEVVDAKCNTLVVPVDRAKVAMYAVRPPASPTVQKMRRIYLTDAQKKLIRKVAGVECNFVELDPTNQRPPIRLLYGIMVPQDTKQ